MLPRAHVRCPACRSGVPRVALWAVGDICPHCSTTLTGAGGRSSERPDVATPPTGAVVAERESQRMQTPSGLAVGAVPGESA
jgi:hypothetical protein